MRCALVVLLVALLLGLGAIFPQYGEEEENFTLEQYNLIMKEIKQNGSFSFPVMSFNIRFDVVEDDPSNNYSRRIPRIEEVFSKWKPYIVGLQEPYAKQVLQLQSVIPKHYKEIGYKRNELGLDHPSRHYDFTIAILYNNEELELIESDFLWLSNTPREDRSKSWGSGDVRALNIARFRIRETGKEVVAMNTHLDRWGELARRKQAALVTSTIREWKARYPDAVFILTGDFNAAPGQEAHDIVTEELEDVWEWCSSRSSSCFSNSVYASFHGWQGSRFNTYLARVIQFIVFIFHGMGASPPIEGQTWKDVANDFIFKPFPIMEAIPSFPRMHMDWVLFSGKELEPKMISVVDVRAANFSSDHFPIVSLFQI